MKHLLTLILTALTTVAFGQNCEKFVTGQFAPIEQNTSDSIFYLITFSDVYEFHTTQEYYKIYDIRWYDHCSFDILLKNSSSKSISKQKGKSLNCSIEFINDATIAFKMANKTKRLKQHKGEYVWSLLLKQDPPADIEENSDENGMSLFMGDALKEKMDSFMSKFKNLKLQGLPIQQKEKLGKDGLSKIAKIFDQLKTFNSKEMYANCSTDLRKHTRAKTFDEYISFIKNNYGEWKYFTVIDDKLKSPLTFSEKKSDLKEFKFQVKFEKYKKELTLILSLREESKGVTRLETINFIPEEYESSVYIEDMTARFFSLFYQGKYSVIYDESADEFKDYTTNQQFDNFLSDISKLIHGQKFTYISDSFYINEDNNGGIEIKYAAETDTNKIYLYLNFTSDPKNYQIVGISMDNIRKYK